MSLKTEKILSKHGVTKEDRAIWLLEHIREHLTPLDAPLDMYGIDYNNTLLHIDAFLEFVEKSKLPPENRCPQCKIGNLIMPSGIVASCNTSPPKYRHFCNHCKYADYFYTTYYE